MAPTQCKGEGQAESPGTALSWHYGLADRGTSRVPGADEGRGEGAGAGSIVKDPPGPLTARPCGDLSSVAHDPLPSAKTC